MTYATLDVALWQDLMFLPFRRGARGPEAYDCYGLALELCRRQGLPAPAYPTPDDADGIRDAEKALSAHWKACPVTPGAVLLFREGGLPRHVGVAIDADRFIHAAEGIGHVSLDRLSRYWGRALLGAYRPI